MKGTKILSAMLFPLLMWVGCDRLEIPVAESIPDHCIEITLGNLHPSLGTKASLRGDDNYNENLVETVDCFFYTDGGTGSNAVFTALGRGAEAAAEGDSTVYKVKVFFTDADAVKMFGSTSSGTCQLYVICNAPLSYSGISTDVATLKELVVENDFTANTVQSSFVMSADEVSTVTLTSTTSGGETVRSASGRVNVSRACAKVQFYLYIPETFEDEANRIWEPVLDAGVYITMSNAVKKGKVDGDYDVQKSDYVSYGSRAMEYIAAADTVSGYGNYRHTHVPFYSYPCSWSDLSDNATTVVFRIAWRIVGADSYQWKKYQLSPNVGTLSFERNHCYRTFVAVRSLGGADQESLVVISDCDYYIMDWQDESATTGEGEVPGELTTYQYLVIDNPSVDLFNENTASFTYVSSSNISSVTIDKVTYYDYTQSGDPTVEVTNASTIAGIASVDYSTPGIITLTHSLSGVYVIYSFEATVTNADGLSEKIYVTQMPPIYVSRRSGWGAFVDGYFAYVYDGKYADGVTHGGSVANYTYSGTTYTGYYTSPSQGSSSATSTNTGTINTPYSILRRANVMSDYTLLDLTQVTVSSFTTSDNTFTSHGGTAEYIIGDPRQASGWSSSDLEPWLYLVSGSTITTKDWSSANGCDAADIMVGTTSPNMIAPSLLFSSAWNSVKGGTAPSFENATKRCATYQEGGYPAGRWRLPTEAEINYVRTLQGLNQIQTLFGSEQSYWASSGYAYNGSSYTQPSSGAIRCVYDVWYWGATPEDPSYYHPMPN